MDGVGQQDLIVCSFDITVQNFVSFVPWLPVVVVSVPGFHDAFEFEFPGGPNVPFQRHRQMEGPPVQPCKLYVSGGVSKTSYRLSGDG